MNVCREGVICLSFCSTLAAPSPWRLAFFEAKYGRTAVADEAAYASWEGSPIDRLFPDGMPVTDRASTLDLKFECEATLQNDVVSELIGDPDHETIENEHLSKPVHVLVAVSGEDSESMFDRIPESSGSFVATKG